VLHAVKAKPDMAIWQPARCGQAKQLRLPVAPQIIRRRRCKKQVHRLVGESQMKIVNRGLHERVVFGDSQASRYNLVGRDVASAAAGNLQLRLTVKAAGHEDAGNLAAPRHGPDVLGHGEDGRLVFQFEEGAIHARYRHLVDGVITAYPIWHVVVTDGAIKPELRKRDIDRPAYHLPAGQRDGLALQRKHGVVEHRPVIDAIRRVELTPYQVNVGARLEAANVQLLKRIPRRITADDLVPARPQDAFRNFNVSRLRRRRWAWAAAG